MSRVKVCPSLRTEQRFFGCVSQVGVTLRSSGIVLVGAGAVEH